MVQRVAYRKRTSYNTKSNQTKTVKTPGGKLVLQYTKKKGSIPICGDCKNTLRGLPHARSMVYRRLHKTQTSVSRAYGGSRCHSCVRQRIVRAFLIEEQKIVKAFLKQREVSTASKKKDTKKTKSKSSNQ